MTVYRRVLELFDDPSTGLDYGESVTLGQHMLQTAAAAAQAGADEAVVVAALLHDVGHLVAAPTNDALGNRFHARDGARLLADLFPPTVTDAVRLHVAAKRYLVATEPGYRSRLSPASVRTLDQQGGPLDPAGVARFEAEPHAHAAVEVRRFDDAGKVAGLEVPALESYRSIIESVARDTRRRSSTHERPDQAH